MLSKEQKIKLLVMYNKGEITREQLKIIKQTGYPAPIFFELEGHELSEHEKQINSVMPIYKKLGQKITGITFEVIK